MAQFPGDAPIQSGNRSAEDHADWLADVADAIEDVQQAVAEAFAGQDGVLQHGSGQDGLTVEATSPASMSVLYNPGVAVIDGIPFWVRLQDSLTFTAPTSYPRIDLVQANITDREISVVEGTEDASPSPPSPDAGAIVLYQVYHRVGESSLKDSDDGSNGYLVDVRAVLSILNGVDKSSPTDGQIVRYNPTTGQWEPVDDLSIFGEFLSNAWGGADGVIQNARDEFEVVPQTTPDMTVRIMTGLGFVSNTPVWMDAAVDTEAITAPSVNPRVDLVQVSKKGLITVKTGAEAASPVAPSPDTDNMALATISLAVGQTTVTGAHITDQRTFFGSGGGTEYGYLNLTTPSAMPEATDGAGSIAIKEETLNTEKANFWRMPFDKDTAEHAFWNLVLPSDYASGLSARVYWCAQNGTAGVSTVKWEIQVVDFDRNSGVLDDAAEEEGWTDGELDIYDQAKRVHATGWIDLDENTDLEGGDFLLVRLRRDVADDDLPHDAYFLGMVLRYMKV